MYAGIAGMWVDGDPMGACDVGLVPLQVGDLVDSPHGVGRVQTIVGKRVSVWLPGRLVEGRASKWRLIARGAV